MARIRTIKPEFWTDSLMVQLPHMTRLLFIALWSLADDHGAISDEPDRIAMQVMPREDPLTVDGHLQLLIACDRLETRFGEDGSSYLAIANWSEHQRIDRPSNSKIIREPSRKLAIPLESRRSLASKYGCKPGETKAAECFYCGAAGRIDWPRLYSGRPGSWVTFPGLEIDHLEPESSGGGGSAPNLVLACRTCNRRKGTTGWLDAFAALNSSPHLASPREPSREKALDQGSGKERKGKGEEGKGNAAPPAPPPSSERTWHGVKSTTIPVLRMFDRRLRQRDPALALPDKLGERWTTALNTEMAKLPAEATADRVRFAVYWAFDDAWHADKLTSVEALIGSLRKIISGSADTWAALKNDLSFLDEEVSP